MTYFLFSISGHDCGKLGYIAQKNKAKRVLNTPNVSVTSWYYRAISSAKLPTGFTMIYAFR
ncbi:MAG: hypothetical protein ABSG74_10740 [Candidatus Bathyarchaeia archaeon]